MAVLAPALAGAALTLGAISGDPESPPAQSERHPALHLVAHFRDMVEAGNERAAAALLAPDASFGVGHVGGPVTARDFAALKQQAVAGCQWSNLAIDPRGLEPQGLDPGGIGSSVTVVADEYLCPSNHPESRRVRFLFAIRGGRIAGIYLDFRPARP